MKQKVCTKFQLELTILILWIKFAQKRYFQSKTEKMSINIEFYIFELMYTPNSSLNWQFWFFGLNLAKKGIAGRKRKKYAALLNSEHSS